MSNNGNFFWQPPYIYTHSILLLVSLIIIGSILQLIVGFLLPVVFPINLFFLLAYIGLLITIFILIKDTELFKWLSGIPLAMIIIYGLVLIGLIAGCIPQNKALAESNSIMLLGFNFSWLYHVIRSWPFIFIFLLLLTNLGLSIINRLIKEPTNKIPFLINHFGIWLVFIGAFSGTDDIKRLKMWIPEKHSSYIAYDENGKQYNMPFEITLRQFKLKEYPVALGLFDEITGSSLIRKDQPVLELQQLIGKKKRINTLIIEVVNFIRYAKQTNDGFIKTKRDLGSPAAYLRIYTILGDKNIIHEGWISRSGPMSMEKTLSINSITYAILKARPKRYSSKIKIVDFIKNNSDKFHKPVLKILEVNKTITLSGWTLYQNSYEHIPGSGLWISVIEAVQDPWLPVIKAGLYIVLFSSIMILIQGIPVKEKS